MSPDFSGNHPLVFLTYDKSKFIESACSLASQDNSIEVSKITNGCDKLITFSLQMSSTGITKSMLNANLDVMIDLCSRDRTKKNSKIAAFRAAPVKMLHMCFLARSCADYLHDYLVYDSIVAPPVTSTTKTYMCEPHDKNLITVQRYCFVDSHMNSSLVDFNNAKTKQK